MPKKGSQEFVQLCAALHPDCDSEVPMDILEQLSVSAPRKSRKGVLELIESVEEVGFSGCLNCERLQDQAMQFLITFLL